MNGTADALAPERIEYPERDGKPMGETDFHISVLLDLRQGLDYFFRDVADVYVAANMFLYYEEGKPSSVVAPDVFVVRGVEKKQRRTFMLWKEKAAPCVVFEITSMTSRIEDLGTKRAVYELLGVREYFLFDPLDEYLRPRLQGYRLSGGQYRKLLPGKSGILRSQELGLILRPVGTRLRLMDPKSGETLPDLREAMARALSSEQRAREAQKRAETEARRAETEARRAETEAQRAERAEREIARLKAKIEALRSRR